MKWFWGLLVFVVIVVLVIFAFKLVNKEELPTKTMEKINYPVYEDGKG